MSPSGRRARTRRSPTSPGSARLPVDVVVPTLNPGAWLEGCLASISAQRPARVFVVDGGSSDGTPDRAAGTAVVLHNPGIGPAAARNVGIAAAVEPWVALIDADVVLPPGALESLLAEAIARGLDGIQARLAHESAPDYWSRHLAAHHARGRSSAWFGVSAALVRREWLERVPFDERLASGEDVDLRRRLDRAGARTGVSATVVVRHRYGPGRAVAQGQWLEDGAGLGRIVRKEGWPGVPLAFLPLAAAAWGLARSPADGFSSVGYYLAHAFGNAAGLVDGLLDRRIPLGRGAGTAIGAVLVMLWLSLAAVVTVPLLLLRWLWEQRERLGQLLLQADWIGVLALLVILATVAWHVVDAGPPRERRGVLAAAGGVVLLASALVVIAAVVRIGAILGVV